MSLYEWLDKQNKHKEKLKSVRKNNFAPRTPIRYQWTQFQFRL